MRILDIDLDIFQDDICFILSNRTTRPNNETCSPWPKTEVVNFLEKNCCLNKENPKPGEIFENHDELFFFIKELIDIGKLETPFELVHVDAHSDIGMNNTDWVNFLGISIEQRIKNLDFEKINEGNFLLYFVILHWMEKLIYIMHPKANLFQDFNYSILKDSNTIQLNLKNLSTEYLKQIGKDKYEIKPDPKIEFQYIYYHNYKSQKDFDYIFLTKSPKTTVEKTNELIPIISSYIKLL